MSSPAPIPSAKAEDWRWAELGPARALVGVAPPANDRLPDVAAHWLDIESPRHMFVAGQPVGDVAAVSVAADAPAHPLADLATDAKGFSLKLGVGEQGGTVQLLHIGTGGAAHGATRIELAAGASLTLIESFADTGDDHWLNHRFDAILGPGARLIRIIRVRNSAGLVSDRAFARLGEDANLTQLLIATSQGAVRTDVEIDLAGARAHANVHGILLGQKDGAQDALTRMRHAVPDTSSTQKWRLVAAERARVSVSGGVYVARDAQKTDADQSLRALVIHRTASANLKPELEIFADDVKCAHGCTVGELDKAALFYLASRGVPPAQAKALLTRAFVADALQDIADESLRDSLDAETQEWLTTAAAQSEFIEGELAEELS